jgi:putative DNA methylase
MPTLHSWIKENPESGWTSRGYLPHLDGHDVVQFITYRLADSLPRNFLTKLKAQLDRGEITEIEYHRRVERYLDLGHGPSYLGQQAVAAIIEENLLRFDGDKYSLLHWVLMPNHVHILLRILNGHSLAAIMHSIKSYTANQANRVLGRTGSFWSVEYYDRFIRDGAHYTNVVNYIHRNPVKAGLCGEPGDWEFGCARRHD